jgi:hypothetical protein
MRPWLLTVLIFAMAGCGYTTGSLLPSKFRSIYVENFKNSTSFKSENIQYVPLLEVRTRDAVVNRFMFDGNLRIGKAATSDMVLQGELKGLERHELRLTENQDVQEFRINVYVDLTLWDPVEDKIIWSESNFAGEATYFVTGPQAKPESAAIEDALNDLARRIVERTLEDW